MKTSLPKGYKRWPALRRGEMCDAQLPTGRVPDATKPCPNKAHAVYMLLDNDGPFMFIALCETCGTIRYAHDPHCCSKKRYEQCRRLPETHRENPMA